MRVFVHLFVAIVLGFISGCVGGATGGGGGGIQASGVVKDVSTGEGPDPVATVTIGSSSTQTQAISGNFQLNNVEQGSSSMTVTSNYPTFNFEFPAILASVFLGEFWIGPDTVTIVGSVVDVNTTEPIAGVLIKFAGRRALTDSNGEFILLEVAYDYSDSFIFDTILGTAEKEDYIPTAFTANQNPIQGVITLPPILMAPSNDPNPPPPPYNLWGNVTTSDGASSSGATVTLFKGPDPIRVTTVDANGKYYFWVPPFDYDILVQKNGYQDAMASVSGFTNANQIIQVDIHLIKN